MLYENILLITGAMKLACVVLHIKEGEYIKERRCSKANQTQNKLW